MEEEWDFVVNADLREPVEQHDHLMFTSFDPA